MFSKIVIANRGEIAVRIIKTCKQLGIKTVCVCSNADKDAAYLNDADEVVNVDSPAEHSYLNQEAIIDAANKTCAQAIHPGFGFLSENAIFAARCLDNKITFIGPKPVHINLMGNKSIARKTFAKAGIATIDGSSGVVDNVHDALSVAQNAGYPVLLKASAGGGGKGIYLIENDLQMKSVFLQAAAEAKKLFNDEAIYIEKYIENARHIEFQILADNYGKVVHLGERECSIQRRHQKLLEESPANRFDGDLRNSIGNKLIRAIQKIGYSNIGTIEFLMDKNNQLYFMEMNTRLQVEHPVTEMVTGIDIVKYQIMLAANYPLDIAQEDIKFQGHAIECRINAEDPENNFKPCPGRINSLRAPKNSISGPIRLDTHIYENYLVPPFYDSMLAKVITHGSNRKKAIGHMQKALTNLKIKGIKTTIPMQLKILSNTDFTNGNYDCSFMSKNYN